MHAAVEEVNPNEAPAESIASIYEWMITERAARKKRKWEEKQLKKRVERKKQRKLLKEVIAYRKSKAKKNKTNTVFNENKDEEEEGDLEIYSYDEMHLAFSSEDI